jgi:hypothetical protein
MITRIFSQLRASERRIARPVLPGSLGTLLLCRQELEHLILELAPVGRLFPVHHLDRLLLLTGDTPASGLVPDLPELHRQGLDTGQRLLGRAFGQGHGFLDRFQERTLGSS